MSHSLTTLTRVELGEAGLVLPHEQWREFGKRLIDLCELLLWWLGDLFNYGGVSYVALANDFYNPDRLKGRQC